MRPAHVVVWGLGLHAIKNILPALKLCSDIRLYGVCSRNQETVSKSVAEYGCIGWAEPIAMLADPQVEVVYLATPIGLHAENGRAALLAGKHLWCEKPLANSLEDSMDLVDLSRRRGLTLAEGFMYLYHPQFLYVRTIIESAELGDLQTIICRFGIPPLERPGFRNDAKLGGGAFWDVGSYLISAMVSLFPGVEPDVLLSEIATVPGQTVDSSGRAVFRYRSHDKSVYAYLEWGTQRAYRNEIDVWGEKGSVVSERFFSKPADYVPRFRFLNKNGSECVKVGESGNHFVAMFDAFSKLLLDSVGAENERILIKRRAQLMAKIMGNIGDINVPAQVVTT